MFTRTFAVVVSVAVVVLQTAPALAARPDFSGTWANEKVRLVLTTDADRVSYKGSLSVGGKTYPVLAKNDDVKGFHGVFNTPQQQFAFSITASGEGTITLSSGSANHQLRRVDAGGAAGEGERAAMPPLLKPGTRITWRGGAATRAGAHLVPDPEGLIMVNGVRHSLRESRGGGGEGYTQLTIQQAQPDLVACEVRNFILNDAQKNLCGSGLVTGIGGDVNRIGDLWVNPQQLAALRDGRDVDGTTIYRRNFPIGQQQFQAITIYRHGGSIYTSHTYDLATGVLLFKGQATVSPNTIIKSGNDTYNVNGNVDTEHMQFVHAREVKFAFAGEPMPQWAAVGRRLDYRGHTQVVHAQLQGLPQLPPAGGHQSALTFTIENTAPGYFTAKQALADQNTVQFGLQGQPVDRMFGGHMYRGLWASPRVMQAMQPNQVLDQDPVTGFRTLFAGVQNGVATIVEQGPAEMTECFYDMQSGVLTAFRYSKKVANSYSVDTYQLVGQQ